jgi:transcriptional regulator with XRE-family HTH domain
MENEWRERLKEAINESGKSLRSLSQATGFGENYVQQLLKDEKDPAFPRLAKLLSLLGANATLYVMLGIKPDTESQLRSALLAYGVDQSQLKLLLPLISKFVPASEALPEQNPRDDQSQPASPRRESVPSRRQPQRSTA